MSLNLWLDGINAPPKGWRAVKSFEEFFDILEESGDEIRQISLSAQFDVDGIRAAREIDARANGGYIPRVFLALHEVSSIPATNAVIRKHFASAQEAWNSLEED
jgi:hypothetical protein